MFKTRKRIVKSNRKRNDDGVLVGSEKENRLEMLPREPFENALYKEKDILLDTDTPSILDSQGYG